MSSALHAKIMFKTLGGEWYSLLCQGQLIGQAELEQIRFADEESVESDSYLQQGCLSAVSRSVGRFK